MQFDNAEIIYFQSQPAAATAAYLPYVCTAPPSEPVGWVRLTEETFEPGTPATGTCTTVT